MSFMKWLTYGWSHIKCEITYAFLFLCEDMNLSLPFLFPGKDLKSFVQLYGEKRMLLQDYRFFSSR